MVDPQQSLGSAYHVSVEKVFVCSGLDGYIPEHNPDSGQYGCLADSKLLSYRFKILVSSNFCSNLLSLIVVWTTKSEFVIPDINAICF